jgi:hypothetical protein
MTRESADAKARRYLSEGRLQVLEVGPSIVRATCRGDGQVYRCGWWRGRWGCTCPAAGTFRAACAHLLALRLVVNEPSGDAAGPRPLTAERFRREQAKASRVRAGRRSA